MKQIFTLFLILLLLGIISLIYIAYSSPKSMLKDNIGIEVSSAKIKNHILNEESFDACIYDIYETLPKDRDKIKMQLEEISKENLEFITDTLRLFINENVEEYILAKENYYKYEYKNNRRRLVIYIPNKDELHYFSVHVSSYENTHEKDLEN